MRSIRFLWLATVGISWFVLGTSGQNSSDKTDALFLEYQRLNALYEYADNVSERKGLSLAEEERLNQEAQDGFENLIPRLTGKGHVFDSLRFHCHFKSGIIHHYFGRLVEANRAYLAALGSFPQKNSDSDSLLFKPLLYSGIIYYGLGQMDSSILQYTQAEKLSGRFQGKLLETERLYNSLGALFYETGNYRQAQNYFEKAVTTLPRTETYYRELLVNYKNNLAATLTRLEEYDPAMKIYREILPYGISRNDILHNMGIINLNLDSTQRALEYFRQVSAEGMVAARLANNIARAHFKLTNPDSCSIYLEKAEELQKNQLGSRKNTTYGITLKYRGDLEAKENQFEAATKSYHASIIQFYPDFNNPDILVNPGGYSGVFSYINLFNALSAKADAFTGWYDLKKETRLLEAALNAYQSAFKLAEYVEKTYDSDEARLFLNKIKYTVHHKPIDLCTKLHQLTGKESYQEEAYLFDQRNKASILTFNVQTTALKNRGNIPAAWLEEEKRIRSTLTRLSLKAANTTDSATLTGYNVQIRDLEIELGKIQDRIKEGGGLKDFTISSQIPSINILKNKILDSRTGILSYHLSETQVLIFCITRNQFLYKYMDLTKDVRTNIDSFIKTLQSPEKSLFRSSIQYAQALYKTLVGPFETEIRGLNRLIIIPDDELNYIPFETLVDGDGKYLIERYAVQYQYATALLTVRGRNVGYPKSVLGFAPFHEKGNSRAFSSLPYSAEEITGLNGKILLGKEATRERFLTAANQYPILHLATHAQASDAAPLQSYIAFYSGDTAEKLYAREIYDLKLDSTELVILSACETGTGKLVRGEGMMSLTRAFSYAGCPNIVASLWKAEDRSTSFITRRFHQYLQKGKTMDEALRRAKLDLLNSDEFDPAQKVPANWGHLIFIGNYQTGTGKGLWTYSWPAILILGLLLMLWLAGKKRTGP